MEQEEAKTCEAFHMAISNALAKQDLTMADGVYESHQGKDDTGITLLGQMLNGAVQAVASLTGLGHDEEIQDTLVTGDDAWQDSFGETFSNSDL